MKKIIFKILHFLPVFILLIILNLLNRASFSYMNAGTDYFISEVVSNIILCVTGALLYCLLLNHAVSIDVDTDDRLYDGSNVFVFVLKDPGFYISTGFVIFYDLLFSSSVSKRLSDAVKIKPLAVLISLVFIIALSLFIWVKHIKNHTEIKKVKALSAILGFAIPSATVCTLTYFIPLIAVQWNVFIFLGRFVIIGLSVFLLIFYSVKFLKAVAARKKFLSNLKSACREKGYELSEIHRPVLSVFRDDGKINYTVKNKDTITEHKLAACINRSTNVLFFDGGGIIKDLPVKLGKNNILFSFRNRLYIKSEKCYVIYTSPPNNALDGTSNGKALIDNGMKVGTLTYYTSTGYLNDLERGLIK